MRARGVFFMSLFLFLLAFLPHSSSFAQTGKKNSPPETSTTNPNVHHKIKKKKQLLEIYRDRGKWILYGNKCADDFTKEYGFKYVIISDNRKLNAGEVLHNFFTNFKLTFKNGPFWKIKLKKKLKECRSRTADEMG